MVRQVGHYIRDERLQVQNNVLLLKKSLCVGNPGTDLGLPWALVGIGAGWYQ